MKNELKEELKTIKKDLKNKEYKKQIANFLTSLRLLAPFVLIPLFITKKLKIAIIMIILFSLTDAFDGYFARKYNAISKFGKCLDCVVDKVFALTILISILIINQEASYFKLIIVNIILEVIITVINTYSFFKKLNPASTKLGKLKTIFLFSLLALIFLNNLVKINSKFIIIFNIITIIFQIATIISYIFQIKKRKQLIVS